MTVYVLGMLLLKSTLVFAAGLVMLRMARRAPASLRHAISLYALALPMLLPVALLMPARGEVFRISVGAAGVSRATASTAASFSWLAWLVGIWAFGAVIVLLRVAAGYWQMARVRRAAVARPGQEPVWFADVAVPMVTGLRRPQILLPHAAAEWPEAQTQAAIDHELAHVRRRDLHTGFLALMARAVYWFHPLAWMLAARLRDAQEDACDDLVLTAGFVPADYADALLATARGITTTRNNTTLLYGCAMTTQTNLKTRIARLLDSGLTRSTSTKTLRRTGLGFAALLIAVAMLGSARADEVYKAGGDVTAPSVTVKTVPPYPPGAKADHVQGKVVLQMVVGVDGFARDFTVQESPDPRLSDGAIAAVQQWRFAPGTKNGQAVAVMATIEINYTLQ